MSTSEQVEALLTEIGELNTSIEAITRNTDYWVIHVDSGLAVTLEWEEKEDLLGMTLLLGEAQENRYLYVCEVLMAYNALWRQTGGIRIGFSGEGKEFLQIFTFPLKDLTPHRFHAFLLKFLEQAELWQQFIASESSEEATTLLENSKSILPFESEQLESLIRC